MSGRKVESGFAVAVECHAGYRGDEQPRRFRFGKRTIEIEETLDQWHGPDYRYFKLRGSDRAIYILRHDESADRWEMTMFEAGAPR